MSARKVCFGLALRNNIESRKSCMALPHFPSSLFLVVFNIVVVVVLNTKVIGWLNMNRTVIEHKRVVRPRG